MVLARDLKRDHAASGLVHGDLLNLDDTTSSDLDPERVNGWENGNFTACVACCFRDSSVDGLTRDDDCSGSDDLVLPDRNTLDLYLGLDDASNDSPGLESDEGLDVSSAPV